MEPSQHEPFSHHGCDLSICPVCVHDGCGYTGLGPICFSAKVEPWPSKHIVKSGTNFSVTDILCIASSARVNHGAHSSNHHPSAKHNRFQSLHLLFCLSAFATIVSNSSRFIYLL